MGDGVFNIAKGRGVELYNRVKSNDPSGAVFVIVLLKASGLEADDTLNNYDALDALLTAANDEADFTNYARKILTDADIAALPAPDDANNRRDLDLPDQTWTAAGGATNNTLGKVVICYDPVAGSGGDSELVPVSFHDFSAVTDGNDLVLQFAAAGFYRAA